MFIKKTPITLNVPITKDPLDISFQTVLYTFLVFFFTSTSWGKEASLDIQTLPTEIITERLQSTPNGCDKGKLLNELSYRELYSSPISSRIRARKALKLARQYDCQEVLGTAHNRLGALNNILGQLDSALFHYEECYEIRKQLRDSSGLFGVLKNLGDVYRKAGNFEKSIASLNLAQQYSTDPLVLARTEVSLTATFRETGQFLDATKAINKAFEYLDSISPHIYSGRADAHLAYSYLYDDLGDYGNALKQARLSKECYGKTHSALGSSRAVLALGNAFFHLSKLDSSLLHFKEFYEFKSNSTDTAGVGKSLVSIGLVFQHMGETDSALHYLTSALNKYVQSQDVELGFLVHEKLGDVYQEMDSIRTCLPYYQKAYELAKELGDLLYQTDVMDDYSKALRRAGNHQEASAILSEYSKLVEDIKDNLQKVRIYEVQLERRKNEISEKEKEIIEHQSEKRLMQIYLLAGGGIIAILIFLFTYQRERHKRQMANKEVDQLLKKRELQSIVNVLEIQEKERVRIAGDLHDRLGGMLATMQLLFHDVQKSIGELQEESRDTYDKALGILDNAGEEVRKVAHNLISGALKNYGLEVALRELADTIQQSESINFTFITHGMADRLPVDYESHLYRVVQEMVSNTLKHSKASKINLQLIQNEDYLSLVYEDDGQGFDPHKVSSGMGLKSIDSRIKKLDGAFEVDSGKGGGTTYNITVPIKQQQP